MSQPASTLQFTLPWREPETAFTPLEPLAGSLLLHGGTTPSRLYAFPSQRYETNVAHGRFAGHVPALRAALAAGHQIAGLLSYEFAGAFEALDLARSEDWPDLMLGTYPAWAVFPAIGAPVEIHGEAGAARQLADALGASALPDCGPGSAGIWTPRWTREAYLAACARIKAHIRAGDIYQANLSQGFDADLVAEDTPFATFRRLIGQSAASHGGYFRIDADRAVLTNSPETFLTLRGGILETRPIKGTRPRGSTPAEDTALGTELLASGKDRAENLMIVDLMRHDLSRVCEPGSVRVPDFCALESYANVHHLVSTVRGRLRAGCDAFDAVMAAFPPGSITGAPKIRAMEIIAGEEGEARGPYCGAMGWIGEGGEAMDFNVMIRTAAMTRGDGHWRAAIRSGGAITAESDCGDEYAETLAKASALKRVFYP